MTFEQTMSTLAAAIGNVARLETVTQEQYDRLKLQCDRLDNAIFIHWLTANVDD
jgi:hypothetical protein